MPVSHRTTLTERDEMEGGIRCPTCGTYTSFSDIIATGHCRGAWTNGCRTGLSLDLVVTRR